MDVAGSLAGPQSFGPTVNGPGGMVVQGIVKGNVVYNNYSINGEDAEAEAVAIEEWLSPCDFAERQSFFRSTCFPGIGQWLLNSYVFKHWAIGGRPWYLRCHGKVGSGKTILSSIVVDHLIKKFECEDKPVIYMYLAHKDSKVNTLANLFGSLLKQLIQLKSSGGISSALKGLYRRRRIDKTKSWQDIFELLKAEILNYERVYVVVDALDECPPDSRQGLEDELRNLQSLEPGKLSLMITARESEDEAGVIWCDRCKENGLRIYFHCDICNDGNFDLCQSCKDKGESCNDKSHKSIEPYGAVEVEIRARESDLTDYIRWEIGERLADKELRDPRTHPNRRNSTVLVTSCREDPDLLRRIIQVIVEKADGRFLVARLYMDQLKHAKNVKDIKTTLDGFPRELDTNYEMAMQRIQSHEDRDDRLLAFRILSLISCAYRYFSLVEIQHLLATDPGDTDFDKDKVYKRELILSITAGLISIADHDANADVRLLHYTLYDYLNKTRREWFPSAQLDMASACMTYLNFDAFSTPCRDIVDFNSKRSVYPFIAYASQHWGDHVRDAGPNHDLEDRAFRYIKEPRRIEASMQAASWTDSLGSDGWDVCVGVADLHICAWFGLPFIISALEGEGTALEIDVRELTYQQTPLMYACRRGHVAVVRQLLDRNAAINLASTRKRTAMLEAVVHNQEEVVKLLLKIDELEVNAAYDVEDGRTALMIAAREGRFHLVSNLLKRSDIQVNMQDAKGYTALCLAVSKESFPTVKILLENTDINLDLFDYAGRSAMSLAALRNNAPMVELLLEKGADPSVTDKQGHGTAILRAIDWGSVDVVELMLKEEMDVDVDCLDDDDRGLVHSASINGYPDIVRMLKIEELDLNAQDKYGVTPLHDASREGYLDVVSTLIELGADTNIKDHSGKTPLDLALEYGRTEIIGVLDDQKTINRLETLPTLNAETSPIWAIVRADRSDLVSQAIATRQTDLLEKEPGTENTALHCAVHENNTEILRILLEGASMSANLTNRYLRTPLHLAALNGYLDAAELLLSHNADIDPQDQWAFTPLHLALRENQAESHFPVAIALIEAGADTETINIQDLFFVAVELGKTVAVKILMDKGADVLGQDCVGRRAMEVARENGDEKMEDVLRASKGFRYMKTKEEGGKNKRRKPKVKVGTLQPSETV